MVVSRLPARFSRLLFHRRSLWLRCTILGIGLVTTAPSTPPSMQREPVEPPAAVQFAMPASGAILINEPSSGLQSVHLPTLQSSVLRAGQKGGLPIFSIAGPDLRGQVAFIVNDMLRERHELRLMAANGHETTVFARAGDALWEHAVGDHLALTQQGDRVALVAQGQGVQFTEPSAYLYEGALEIWNTDSKQRLVPGVRALDDTLAWFPDGHRLAFTALMDPIEAAALHGRHVAAGDAFAAGTLGWSRVPVVQILDVDTGLVTAAHVGQRPTLSPDGRTLLVRDFDLHWRALDLSTNVSRPVSAPSAMFPGAIGFADSQTVLYWAWPAADSEIRYTENNSPLVGKKRMLELRLVNLHSGGCQTVVPAIDPRRKVSIGCNGPGSR